MGARSEEESYRVDAKHNLFSSRQMKHLCSVCNLEMHDHICGAPGHDVPADVVCKQTGTDFDKVKAECAKTFDEGSDWLNVCIMETCASLGDAVAISKIEQHIQREFADAEE